MIDLLVAGGGPAGLATAIHAARAGMRVVGVEPRPVPVDKACGEGLLPPAVAALRRLDVMPPGRAFHGIRYVDGPHQAVAAFSGGAGLGVRRTALQAALAARARALEVRIVAGRVGAVRQDADGVAAAGWRARYLVAADGLHSPIRRQLGLAAPVRGEPRYGLRRHFAVRPWTDLVEVHWSPRAEAYVTPVADDLVGVAVLRYGRGRYGLAEFPALAERLAGAPPVTPVRGAGPLRQRVRTRVAGRVLLVGDAAGYVDALTGEGISLAFAAAETLVECLVAGRPGAYERAWRRLSRQYRVLTELLLAARRRPWARERLVPAAAGWPGLFAAAVDQLARPVGPPVAGGR